MTCEQSDGKTRLSQIDHLQSTARMVVGEMPERTRYAGEVSDRKASVETDRNRESFSQRSLSEDSHAHRRREERRVPNAGRHGFRARTADRPRCHPGECPNADPGGAPSSHPRVTERPCGFFITFAFDPLKKRRARRPPIPSRPAYPSNDDTVY